MVPPKNKINRSRGGFTPCATLVRLGKVRVVRRVIFGERMWLSYQEGAELRVAGIVSLVLTMGLVRGFDGWKLVNWWDFTSTECNSDLA
jgi:hypothetical protein